MENLRKLPDLIHTCMTIGMLPSSYKISMTYEEQLLWFCNFLEKQVIPVVNNNSKVVEELKYYLQNLDVQNEINNKLDKMAEDGTLTEIISQYIELQSLLMYNSVADMKNAENLKNGSFVKTLGFYETSDFGGAFYKVRTITNNDSVDNITIIALHDNTLIAELLINDYMNIRQFGATGNGVTNDTINIQKCIDNVKNVIIPSGTYMIKAHDEEHKEGPYNHNNLTFNGGLQLKNNTHLIGLDNSNCILKAMTNESENYNIIRAYEKNNITIENLNLIGDKETHSGLTGEWGHAIMILHCQNVEIKNCKISQLWGDGIYLGLIYNNISSLQNENINILNNIIDTASRNGISMCSGKNVFIDKNKIMNTIRTNPKAGIDIEPEGPGITNPILENINITNLYSFNNHYGIKLLYTDIIQNDTILNINNMYSKEDYFAFYFSSSNNANYNDMGEILLDNINAILSGWSAFEITNWKDSLPNIIAKNLNVLNCNNTNHNTDNNLTGWRNGSGLVIFNDNDESVSNISIENLKVIDDREIKYINKGYYSGGMIDGKIKLVNPITLFGLNENSFGYTLLKDGNQIMTNNIPYFRSIINARNLNSLYLSSGTTSERYINLQDDIIANDMEILICNDSDNNLRIDTGEVDSRIQLFPYSSDYRYIRTTEKGALMKIKKINGNWYATSIVGTWSQS